MSSNGEDNTDQTGQHTDTSTGQDVHSGGNPKKHGNTHQTPTSTNTKNKANMSGNSGTGFRGDAEKMRGYVFEVPPRNSQMSDTLDMLKRYVRSNYKSAPLLCTLFATKPTKPAVEKPSDSAVPTGAPTTKGGQPVLTDFDKEIYKEPSRGTLLNARTWNGTWSPSFRSFSVNATSNCGLNFSPKMNFTTANSRATVYGCSRLFVVP